MTAATVTAQAQSFDLFAWLRRLAVRSKAVPAVREAAHAAPAATLAKGATHRFAGLQEARIVCERGEIWITVDGWQCDVVMAEGEEWVVGHSAPVLVMGLDDGGAAYQVVRNS